jgi:DNA-binding transcriptional ArsR family regulator/precorrin-6B methylase 2
MPASFLTAVSALRAAGEPTRLRLLALLAQAELTVGEICEIVGQSQPRVSRHLKLLCDAGLLDRFREQHWVYYRAPVQGAARDTLQAVLDLVQSDDDLLRRDRKRMSQVIKERARQAAVQLPGKGPLATSDSLDSIVRSELAAEPIGALLDVGTGGGHLLKLLGAVATRAVGIDISSEALRMARTNVHGAGLGHCELQRGDMYDLPFTAPLFDTATADRVLADAERPVAVLMEIARTVKGGGRLIVIEDFDALSATVGAKSGNPIATLRDWFAKAGFECVRVHPVDTESGHLLVALARRVVHTTAAA